MAQCSNPIYAVILLSTHHLVTSDWHINFLLTAFCTHGFLLTAARQAGDVLSTAIFKSFHPPPHTTGTNADISKYKVDQQYLQLNTSPLQEIQSQHSGKTKFHRQLFC